MVKPKPSPGYIWARRHALVSTAARTAWQFQEKLEQSQWRAAEQHLAYQLRHLTSLVRHAAANVPFYRRSLAGIADDRELTLEEWRALPILKRRDVQAHKHDLQAETYPENHGKSFQTSSSGSTGLPVVILHNDITATWQKALTFRMQLWSMRRFDLRLAVIRNYPNGKADYPNGLLGERWSDDATLPFQTGSVAALRARTPIPDQVEWLLRQRPQMLVAFPSVLDALAQFAAAENIRMPRLKRIQTVGEAHPEGIRGAARLAFGAEIFDGYSANEIGPIAVQCPEAEHYHVQSEAVFVEVLGEGDRECAPGETGRVVVTQLHNYAMPLVRYEIGDYATVGGSCRCGRGLPVIRRILGRQRNMMMMPDGSRFWPSFGTKMYQRVAPVRQAQFVQPAIGRLEARLVTERPITEAEEAALRVLIQARVPTPVEISFAYPESIARNESGKYDDFICLVETTANRPSRPA